VTRHGEDIDRTAEWDDWRQRYLAEPSRRKASAARGVHHIALLSSDVERTIDFYQNLLGFPLVELFENRDYQGSTHFFFDLGHDNYLAFFDFPGLDLGEYAEVLGGLHHLAIYVEPADWARIVADVEAAGIETYVVRDESAYFSGPDGERIELLTFPLSDMYGTIVSRPTVDDPTSPDGS